MNKQCTKVIQALLFGSAMLGLGLGLQVLASETQLLLPGWQLWALGFLILTPLGLLALAWGALRLVERGGRCCATPELCA